MIEITDVVQDHYKEPKEKFNNLPIQFTVPYYSNAPSNRARPFWLGVSKSATNSVLTR